MFYYSTIYNVKVHDKNDEAIGRVKDIVIEINSDKKYPPVKGIVANGNSKKKYFIKASDITNWSKDGIFLSISADQIKEENWSEDKDLLFLSRQVVDRQIVDLSGIKVVRVNDVEFELVHGIMSLFALDVSTSGLLKRLGFRNSFFHLFKPHLLEWKDIHVVGDKLQFNIGKQDLNKLHPADIANLVEGLNLKQGSQLLRSLDENMAAKVMEEINPEIQKLLVQHLGAERATQIIGKMSTDELVDLIQLLPKHESKNIMENLSMSKDIECIKKILKYNEDEAGGLMTTEYVYAFLEETAFEVIEKIKKYSHLHRSIFFIYIVDAQKHYLGVVSLRRLITADGSKTMKELLKKFKNIPGVRPQTKATYVANIMTKYNLLSVAVLDHGNRLLGVVTIDDIMRCLIPNA